uniref:Reverse transcriptase domain-containing protein n=1 Tax=Equus asinus TaxID=9793 RepID=A0A9L0K4S7_EQUAS
MDIHKKPVPNIILNDEKLEAFPLGSETKQQCPLSLLLFKIMLEDQAGAIRQEKEIKCIQIGKEEIKRSFFSNDIIIHVENVKESTRKFMELRSNFSKVAGYKVNMQRNHIPIYQ